MANKGLLAKVASDGLLVRACSEQELAIEEGEVKQAGQPSTEALCRMHGGPAKRVRVGACGIELSASDTDQEETLGHSISVNKVDLTPQCLYYS